jgi:4-hydroxyphenylpyruvate dioxygenase
LHAEDLIMTAGQPQSLGIKRVDSLHFFVRELTRSRDHYVERLDFSELSVSGPDFERAQQARAILLGAGDVRFVFIAPLDGADGTECESERWLRCHPEGVGRIVLEVESVERAFALLMTRGATPIADIEQAETEAGTMRWFDIASAFGDTLFRFVERQGAHGLLPGMLPLAYAQSASNRHGVTEIDHITSNFLTLRPAIMWMEEVLGLERYWGIEFHTRDIARAVEARGSASERKNDTHGAGSGLKSIVMWDPASGVKFANNEPAAPAFHASQIYRFCAEHRGAGVQHVALTVHDIVDSVRALRARGVAFMPTPSTYYDLLPQRLIELGVERIDEQVDTLRELEVLVDGDGPAQYLLQIFLREAAGLFDDTSAGPLFIELIQRKGDRGFGAGNFRALFESIERQQAGNRAA